MKGCVVHRSRQAIPRCGKEARVGVVGGHIGRAPGNGDRRREVGLLPTGSALPTERHRGEQLAGVAPQPTQVGTGVAAALVEPYAGHLTRHVGAEPYAQLDRRGVRLGRDHSRPAPVAVGEFDANVRRQIDNVRRGEHLAVVADEDARALTRDADGRPISLSTTGFHSAVGRIRDVLAASGGIGRITLRREVRRRHRNLTWLFA